MKPYEPSGRRSQPSGSRQSDAVRAAGKRAITRPRDDGLVRKTFTLERTKARQEAREFLERFPKAAYWSRVEHWRQLADGRIEFTMVRLPTAD